MIVAAFETSGAVTNVAIGDETRVAQRVRDGARGHVEFCVPALMECLHELGLRLEQIDAFAVGIGPGLFTGLRVGVQTAKTFAATMDRPLVGVSSLETLARGADAPRVLACVNAHRREVFAAAFVDGVRVSDDAPMSPAAAAELARAHDAIVVGDGVRVDAAAFDGLTVREGVARASAVLALARVRLASGDLDDPRTLEPAYLRRSEAEIKWSETGVVAQRPGRVQIKEPRP